MYFLRLVCTFHVTIEMYRAPHGADDFGTGAPDSRGALSKHRFGPAGSVNHYRSGGWRAKGQIQAVF